MQKRGFAFWWLTLVAVWTTINGLAADMNYTHLFNPAWSPHAKFHDWVSIVTGVLTGLAALYYLWRRGARSRADLEFSCVVQALFWVALILGYTFPGTHGTAYEHPEFVPEIFGMHVTEGFLSITSLIAIVAAWPFERRRRAQ